MGLWLAIVLSVISTIFNTTANTLWKLHLQKHPFQFNGLASVVGVFMSWSILVGGFLYATSMVIFFYLLSHYKLSIVIPLASLTYVFNMITAYTIFHEQFYWYHLLAVSMILGGIVLISQTPGADRLNG